MSLTGTSPEEKTPYHHGQLRDALIAAALDLLKEKGVDALSLRALAKATRVSQAAPYSHFEDKDHLLAAVAETGFQRLALQMAQDATGQHTPGPSAEAVRFLVEERDVLGFGSEAIGTDAGQGYHLRPPYPCHSLMHGAGKYGLQCLCNLDQLPPVGAVLICPPLKIQKGSGSPLRVLALVAGVTA